MKKSPYDKVFAHTIIEGTPEERALAVAKIYHKEEEVKAELAKSPYRRNGNISLSQLVDACCDESQKSIDDLVQDEPSLTKVAAKGTLNLFSPVGRFAKAALIGALPQRYQQKIAKNRGEDYLSTNLFLDDSVIANVIVEGITICAGTGALMYSGGGNLGESIGAAVLAGLAYGIFIGSPRLNEDFGSPITTIPFYVTLGIILGVKAAANGIENTYKSAYREEKQKLLPKSEKTENRIAMDIPASLRIEDQQKSDFEGIVEEEFKEPELKRRNLPIDNS